MCNIFQSPALRVSVCARTDGEPMLETAAAAVGYAVWWAAASSGRPAPSVQPEKRSSLLAIVLAVEWMEGAAARANGACTCVCACVCPQ